MGGKAFDDARPATAEDRARVKTALDNVFPSADGCHSWKFTGSSHYDNRTYGDIDVAVRPMYALLVNKLIEKYPYRTIGSGLHVNIDGIQVDVSVPNDEATYDCWVVDASTTHKFDPYKALFRNELFYVAAKYLYEGKVTEYEDHNVLTFTRARFDVLNGIVLGEYSYQGKTGILKRPVKVRERVICKNFSQFISQIKLEGRPSFTDVLIAMEDHFDRFGPHGKWANILGEVSVNLVRKGYEAPPALKVALLEASARKAAFA